MMGMGPVSGRLPTSANTSGSSSIGDKSVGGLLKGARTSEGFEKINRLAASDKGVAQLADAALGDKSEVSADDLKNLIRSRDNDGPSLKTATRDLLRAILHQKLSDADAVSTLSPADQQALSTLDVKLNHRDPDISGGIRDAKDRLTQARPQKQMDATQADEDDADTRSINSNDDSRGFEYLVRDRVLGSVSMLNVAEESSDQSVKRRHSGEIMADYTESTQASGAVERAAKRFKKAVGVGGKTNAVMQKLAVFSVEPKTVDGQAVTDTPTAYQDKQIDDGMTLLGQAQERMDALKGRDLPSAKKRAALQSENGRKIKALDELQLNVSQQISDRLIGEMDKTLPTSKTPVALVMDMSKLITQLKMSDSPALHEEATRLEGKVDAFVEGHAALVGGLSLDGLSSSTKPDETRGILGEILSTEQSRSDVQGGLIAALDLYIDGSNLPDDVANHSQGRELSEKDMAIAKELRDNLSAINELQEAMDARLSDAVSPEKSLGDSLETVMTALNEQLPQILLLTARLSSTVDHIRPDSKLNTFLLKRTADLGLSVGNGRNEAKMLLAQESNQRLTRYDLLLRDLGKKIPGDRPAPSELSVAIKEFAKA